MMEKWYRGITTIWQNSGHKNIYQSWQKQHIFICLGLSLGCVVCLVQCVTNMQILANISTLQDNKDTHTCRTVFLQSNIRHFHRSVWASFLKLLNLTDIMRHLRLRRSHSDSFSSSFCRHCVRWWSFSWSVWSLRRNSSHMLCSRPDWYLTWSSRSSSFVVGSSAGFWMYDKMLIKQRQWW